MADLPALYGEGNSTEAHEDSPQPHCHVQGRTDPLAIATLRVLDSTQPRLSSSLHFSLAVPGFYLNAMDGVDFADVKHYSTGFQEEKLCHKEPSYRDYVDVLCSRNPCLLNLLSFLNAPQTSSKKCQITALDFHKGKPYPSTRHLPQNIDLLPRELQGKSKGEGKEEDECRDRSLQGRILVIEDLTADVIELLGSSLDIDPLFFALHLHTTSRNDMLSQTPDEATLPSRLVSQDYMNTTYHRPLMCEKMPSARERLVRDMSVKRKLVFIRSTTIGLAQHCVSVIKVNKSSSFWIGMCSP